ncbi:PREDICTED: uncharacterized protein LOC106811968 [Priapulus caudatus]|uniref:Uncharacterized protein LOC106811968 n=1 Tax=Priapulus caudatus TaxID=37621 RepID=A0ABM1EG76_PRICU|nr:PREDICTED: uncharacterized protein LOC106811968 [Priapulus caudatus]
MVLQVDLLGNSIYKILHPDDVNCFKLFMLVSRDSSPELQARAERHVSVRMALKSHKPVNAYYPVSVEGQMADVSDRLNALDRNRHGVFMSAFVSPQHNDAIPVGLRFPLAENQYRTKHHLDGRVIDIDSQAALLTGFMPSYLRGYTPYERTILMEDLPFIGIQHKLIFSIKETKSMWRMMTANGQIVYSHSQSWLINHTWKEAPDYIISINTIMEENRGKLLHDIFVRMVTRQKLPAVSESVRREVEKYLPVSQKFPCGYDGIQQLLKLKYDVDLPEFPLPKSADAPKTPRGLVWPE